MRSVRCRAASCPAPARVGRALPNLTDAAPERFRVRWSGNRPRLTAFPYFVSVSDSSPRHDWVRPLPPVAPPRQHLPF
ncbi:hypothetical protein SUDANB37_05714 [Streptomyces sp. enrichment culture]